MGGGEEKRKKKEDPKRTSHLPGFLKGALEKGSEESEPDMTKSSLLFTFDIPTIQWQFYQSYRKRAEREGKMTVPPRYWCLLLLTTFWKEWARYWTGQMTIKFMLINFYEDLKRQGGRGKEWKEKLHQGMTYGEKERVAPV